MAWHASPHTHEQTFAEREESASLLVGAWVKGLRIFYEDAADFRRSRWKLLGFHEKRNGRE